MSRRLICCLSILSVLLLGSGAWSQEEKPRNKRKKETEAKAEVKKTDTKAKDEAKPKAKAEKPMLEFPPKLAGGQTMVTESSPALLKPVKELPEGVTVATTPPTVDFMLFPGQDYPGRPWSNWGESCFANGKYYCAIGDHLAPQGDALVFEYDPATKNLRKILSSKKLLNMPEGHYAPGKFHSRLGVGKDGWLYCTTHRGSTSVTTDANHYKGDWILRVKPETGEQEIVQVAPVPKHALPCAHLDPDRLIIYGGSAPGSKADTSGIQFWAYDLANRKLLYSGPNGPSRAMMISKSTGCVYYTPGYTKSPLMKFDPKSGKPPMEIPGEIGIRSTTDETADGKIYAASGSPDGNELCVFDVKTEKVKELGKLAVGSEHYVAALSADASGKYLYYSPGAHGGGHRDGSPLVQYNTQTGKRKVICFLHPVLQDKYGIAVHGTYAVSVSPDGSQVFICWNAARAGAPKGWDCCALTAISIPASERE